MPVSIRRHDEERRRALNNNNRDSIDTIVTRNDHTSSSNTSTSTHNEIMNIHEPYATSTLAISYHIHMFICSVASFVWIIVRAGFWHPLLGLLSAVIRVPELLGSGYQYLLLEQDHEDSEEMQHFQEFLRQTSSNTRSSQIDRNNQSSWNRQSNRPHIFPISGSRPELGSLNGSSSRNSNTNGTAVPVTHSRHQVSFSVSTTRSTSSSSSIHTTDFNTMPVQHHQHSNPTLATAAADADNNFPPQTYSENAWAARLAGFPVSRSEMNSLVMNYLIVEGYQDAAVWFAKEANIDLSAPTLTAESDCFLSSRSSASGSSSNLSFQGIDPRLSEAIVEYSNIPIIHNNTNKPSQDSKPVEIDNSPSEADNVAADSMFTLLGGVPAGFVSNQDKPTPDFLHSYQKPRFSLNKVHERSVIKSLILQGRVQEAIENINDVDPQLLDTNSPLHFSLLRLQLIELIRDANKQRLARHREKHGPNSQLPPGSTIADIEMVQPALDFAASHLARRAPANPKFLEHLEQTMALLCFPPDQLVPQLRDLMDLKMRRKVAEDVNTMLLARQGIAGESNIQALVRLWGWAEKELMEKESVDFPLLDPKDVD